LLIIPVRRIGISADFSCTGDEMIICYII